MKNMEVGKPAGHGVEPHQGFCRRHGHRRLPQASKGGMGAFEEKVPGAFEFVGEGLPVPFEAHGDPVMVGCLANAPQVFQDCLPFSGGGLGRPLVTGPNPNMRGLKGPGRSEHLVKSGAFARANPVVRPVGRHLKAPVTGLATHLPGPGPIARGHVHIAPPLDPFEPGRRTGIEDGRNRLGTKTDGHQTGADHGQIITISW